MRKRIISVMLAAVLALSLGACGRKDAKEQDAYRQYGINCLEIGKYDEAIQAFQNALDQSLGKVGAAVKFFPHPNPKGESTLWLPC